MTNDLNEDFVIKRWPSFDIARMFCVALLVVIEFGLYFIPYFKYAKPMLFFAQGTLFTIYGYTVLKDGADLGKYIRHALIAFLIMLVVYGGITAAYYYFSAGDPRELITERTIFNFVVLNIWPTSICSSIWYVQSVLYSLIAFWILRKAKKLDWLLCIVLFAFSIVVGEFAGIVHFSFLGYEYIPGNFLTKTMPYMLLGRLINKYYDEIMFRLHFDLLVYFFIGLVLAIVEFLLLGYSGNLVYQNHFIGFIIMAAALCMMCVFRPDGGKLNVFEKYAPTMYKGTYYVFSPFGYALVIAIQNFCKTETQLKICYYFRGIVILAVLMGVFWFVAFLKDKFKSYGKLHNGVKQNEIE